MKDFRIIDLNRAKVAQQHMNRAHDLEAIARAEAKTWREQAAALEARLVISERERKRMRRAFYLVFAVNVAAFVASAVWAMGRL